MTQNFFEKAFASNAHDQYGSRRSNQESVRNNLGWRHTAMRDLKEHTDRVVQELREGEKLLEIDSLNTVNEEHRIIDAKGVSAEVFAKIYDMEVCLTSRDLELSVEEAVRHVLKLLYVSVKMVDGDEHVQGFKKQILNEVSSRYGPDKVEELKREKRYLEFEI
jgi:hypothetical protein